MNEHRVGTSKNVTQFRQSALLKSSAIHIIQILLLLIARRCPTQEKYCVQPLYVPIYIYPFDETT